MLCHRKDGYYKAFFDNSEGGKLKGLNKALIYRNSIIKIDHRFSLGKVTKQFPKFRSKCYFFYQLKAPSGKLYEICRAFCYDKFEEVDYNKTWSVKKYRGKKKTKALAIAWRNKQRLEIEKKAKKMGLIPSWKNKKY